jgi:predicted nucleic acid-binding Zn ribbon protein
MSACLNCNEALTGRLDKKYCSEYCKSNYHYEQKKGQTNSLFKRIDLQLKLNRRLLKDFNKAGKATVRAEKLLALGFNPDYFTHYWKNSAGDIYLFVYEYGFLKRKENNKTKYVLVTWQDYMNKQKKLPL